MLDRLIYLVDAYYGDSLYVPRWLRRIFHCPCGHHDWIRPYGVEYCRICGIKFRDFYGTDKERTL